jgi:hypothetical protein
MRICVPHDGEVYEFAAAEAQAFVCGGSGVG